MKNLIKAAALALALSITGATSAEVIGSMPNQNAGNVYLTDEKPSFCKTDGFSFFAFVSSELIGTEEKFTLVGCWYLIDGKIILRTNTPDGKPVLARHDVADFNINVDYLKRKRNAPR